MADLDPFVVDKARALAAPLADARTDEDAYWQTVRLHSAFLDHLVESGTAEALYLITAWLTDIWELSPERRQEAAALMRDAATELLTVSDDEELDAYVVRWTQRLGPENPDRVSRLLGRLRRHS